jgi:hypothetical protein
MFASADYDCLNLGPHDRRHRHGAHDLHPASTTNAPWPSSFPHGDLIRLAATGQNVVTLWQSRHPD